MNPVHKLLLLAEFFVGVREEGENRGPVVEQFQKAVDGKASGEPWCMAFQMFLKKEVERVFKFQSPLFESESCMEVWTRSPDHCRLATPDIGTLMIWQVNKSHAGHVELVTEVHQNGVFTVGGNTSNSESVEREGEGVFSKFRSFDSTPNFALVGFLRVFDV